MSFVTLNSGERRKLFVNSSGYLSFKYKNKKVLLHRYLAELHLPNPDNLPQINHKDGNKLNNDLDNLEWVSQRDNLHHAMDMGLHAWGRTAVKAVDVVTGETKYYDSQHEASADGYQQSNINHCLKGKRKTHKGMEWSYD